MCQENIYIYQELHQHRKKAFYMRTNSIYTFLSGDQAVKINGYLANQFMNMTQKASYNPTHVGTPQ